jgi:type IV pilus assembly protein PilQ
VTKILKVLKKICYSLGVFCLISSSLATASDDWVSLDMQTVSLPDALQILANVAKLNISISTDVSGEVALHLQHEHAQAALAMLIKTHGLMQREVNGTLIISTAAEFLQQAIADKKYQDDLAMVAPLISHVWQMHYARAADIAKLIQDGKSSLLSPRGILQIDSRTNRLLIADIAEQLPKIASLIKSFDIPVQQIMIEAHLATVDSDYERQLGINFSVNAAGSIGRLAGYGLAVAKLANGSLLDVQLAAIEHSGHGELISSPRLFTANQQPASIEAGEEIPYQEISESGGTGIVFKKAVLSLKVVPQILPNHQVLLQLQINQDTPSSRIVLGVPAISTRQITTNVLLKNGQTIVLGGSFEVNKATFNERIPFLSKIPLVGMLFEQQNVSQAKRELLIFVTPKIIDVSG